MKNLIQPEILDRSCKWKPVKQFPEVYIVSDDGRVFSKRTQKYLRPNTDKYGYLYYVLCVNGMRRTIKAHRLVADAFIPNPDMKPTVDHINADRKDNRASNLRWATHEEQWLNPHAIWQHRIGAKVAADKNKGIPSKYRKKICAFPIDGAEALQFESLSEACRKLNLNQAHVSECANGKRNQVKGYRFCWGVLE